MTPLPFIVGCPRSGTTMVRTVMNSHPEMAIPPESHFLPALIRLSPLLLRRGGAGAVADYLERHPRYVQWQLPRAVLMETLAEQRVRSGGDVAAAVLHAYALAHGRSRGGDKTPKYASHLGIIGRALPQARVVHVVRDPRDVAASLRAVSGFSTSAAVEGAYRWRYFVSAARRWGRANPDRYIELRYEDLSRDPETGARLLADFVELPFDAQMLNFKRADVHDIQGANFFPENHTKLGTTVNAAEPRWTKDLRLIDIVKVERVTEPLMESLGYTFSSTASERRDATIASALGVRHNIEHQLKVSGARAAKLTRALTK